MVKKEEKEQWKDIVAKVVPKSEAKFATRKLLGYAATIQQIGSKIERLLDNKPQAPTLITGPPKTGKTTLVKCLAFKYAKQHPKFNFFYLRCSWTTRKLFGDPEARLLQLFDEAVEKAPSLIFIDGLDQICSEKRSEPKDRVFNVLEDCLGMLESLKARVLVLAATNKPEAIDPQMRDLFYVNEITFTLPNRQDRKEMLEELASQFNMKLSSDDLQQIADLSHCYVYLNLEELCQIADDIRITEDRPDKEAFDIALSRYKSSKIKSITTPCPPLRWEDIGGVENVKKELQESVIWPLEHRDRFEELGITSNKGALLYGPPGCSKTMLAQALATESGYNFISIKGPELYSKWVGDSEAAVRRLYRKAREIAPCIIFFDEIDGLAPERSETQSSPVGDKVVTQLLTELNGIDPLDNVFTIAATNRPSHVDSALLRPGRLDPAIYIPLPSRSDRYEIFKVHMRPLSLKFDKPLEGIMKDLAERTQGYSGSEIANVCRIAGVLALRESLENRHIEWKHFQCSLETVKPRTRIEQLKSYEKFHKTSLQMGQRASLAGVTDEFDDLTLLD